MSRLRKSPVGTFSFTPGSILREPQALWISGKLSTQVLSSTEQVLTRWVKTQDGHDI